MPDRLMLLDTPSLYFRAFYGVPDSVRSPDGKPVNAVRGLIDSIATLVSRFEPQRLVAAMDADWRPAFRVALIPSYKTHRVVEVDADDTPDALAEQVPVILDVLAAFGIATVGVDGYEADDVIGTYATSHQGPVNVVTGDRDLFQLVRDPDVRVLYTQKGLQNLGLIDEAAVTEKYGIPGRAYADFAILRGDPSDGLPGVPGVGDKTAARLITTYGSVAALRADPAVPAALQARLAAVADYLDAAETVVRVACDLPLPAVDTTLPAAPRNAVALLDLAQRWGLAGAVTRLVDACRGAAG